MIIKMIDVCPHVNDNPDHVVPACPGFIQVPFATYPEWNIPAWTKPARKRTKKQQQADEFGPAPATRLPARKDGEML